MADKKSVGHAYNVDFLNVVFAASSLFLFLSVIWMVWDDFDRDWKKTQRAFSQLETQVTQAEPAAGGTRASTRTSSPQLTAQEAAAKKKVTANQAKVDELQAKLKDADTILFRATTAFQTMKATYDQDRYDFEATRGQRASPYREEGSARQGRGTPAARARPGAREGRSRRGRRPEAARSDTGEVVTRAEVDRRDQRGAGPPRASA